MLFICKKTNRYIVQKCNCPDCEWNIKCNKFCDCSIVAAHFGPFSNVDIGMMMSITGERVRQIESNAIRKLSMKHLKGEIEPIEFDDPPSLFEESLEYM